jgi:hypothetical protein
LRLLISMCNSFIDGCVIWNEVGVEERVEVNFIALYYVCVYGMS